MIVREFCQLFSSVDVGEKRVGVVALAKCVYKAVVLIFLLDICK